METEKTNVKPNTTILVIIGPSASGKTKFAVEVAKSLKKSIISADSRQVYKKLDYSTGKLGGFTSIKKNKGYWIMDGVKYYGYDLLKAYKVFSAYDFAIFANRIIKINKDNLPIICGGTGMYINALINNYDYKMQPANWDLRKKLQNKTAEELLKMLQKKGYDTNLLNNSELHNKQRLIRKIETFKKINNTVKKVNKKSKYNFIFIGLKKVEYDSIIKKWVNKNFSKIVKETSWLNINYPNSELLKGFIFSEALDYINKKIDAKKAKELIFYNYLHYIKRQKTYFKKYFSTTVWFNDKTKAFEYIKKLV